MAGSGGFVVRKVLNMRKSPKYLKNYLPRLNLLMVTMVPSLEYPNFRGSMKGLGDYIIITDGTLEPSH